jgi:periplasmic protein TonB
MRLASFFVLSVSLHAAALVYPVSFDRRSQEQFIQVTILPEAEGGGAGDQGSGGHRPAQVRSRALPRPTSNVHPAAESKPSHSQRQPVRPEAVPKLSDNNVAFFSSLATAPGTSNASPSDAPGQNDSGSGAATGGSGGSGVGSSGAGSGSGNGNGSGAGSGGGEIALTQVRYGDTPRPDYPESARREGRQGSVLLRVLVDEQGRSKKVEINSSSGSEALDRAAAEAIKRWRFIPAHHGDKAVESWIRIPIDFSLVGANSR